MAAFAVVAVAWQAPPNQDAVGAAASPFVKWLDEDVVYIISDQERAAFEKLTTDEEREKFVQQFWQRRDPRSGTAVNEQFLPRTDATRGTAVNAFKAEHYRRIAYANDHFQTATASGRQGWQTDRGHILIVYGPPDEIEASTANAATLFPSQVWSYRHIDRVGDNLSITFVDRTGTGDYTLAPGNAR
jgi:GWxTD domain-containing protein